ncbi:hypothetical protein [Sediminibacillus albus]|uniref:Alpha/beta hydrolase n=1 Tax=Sediminibacillus albus TaxID=407036 RepID=A0A1G8WMM5_9BACI|nr:hypothetical protein [Sediminibacillus albus]SDJ78840.1 hypothetical protein SAMN05216243_0860 [Sediminibacillus albus]
MEIIKANVQAHSGSIAYTYVRNKPDNQDLCIMLPGLGYSTDQPLFYYATGLFFEKGFDVLHINYQYDAPVFKNLEREEQFSIVSEDVQSVLEQVIPSTAYPNFYIMAKSTGTAGLIRLLENNQELDRAKVIWLTPLLHEDDVYRRLLNNSQDSLLIIGDQDRCYMKERVTALTAKNTMKISLMQGTNHSLEHPDGIHQSIECLTVIMREFESFICE